ncbi:NAD(P)-binding domain-containing protein [Ammoniphilus resinae]|uniref:Dinucleotide-binding enzyme n=1 Tax=Ammoniphilus resinae TaxID=861532 RepID=A0ABS4GKT3_9BACL|nr:NAD(P)-binding domain-containing protein [Ammoniphilus resinae]MBP1930849.1 putative dinucleotide-binding enzyme [Ammoniphilus resinae]
MNITILGTGSMGRGLIKTLSPLHQGIKWVSRNREKVIDLVDELKVDVIPVDYELGLDADVIIHTFWFRDLIPWAEENRNKLKGKVLVDIVNPITLDFNDFTLDWGTSAAVELQKVLPKLKL